MGRQQHLVPVPEESSDHVAWRILGGEVLMPGPKPPRISEVSTHTKKRQMMTAKEVRQDSSSSGGLVSPDPWEQEGSDCFQEAKALSQELPCLGILCTCWFWQ